MPERWRSLFGMKTTMRLVLLALVSFLVLQSPVSLAGQAAPTKLTVYGDVAYFWGMGNPMNCVLTSRFKRGEPMGFRVTALDPVTGERDRASKLVVHLTYGGKTIDLPMRDRQTDAQPERAFFVAKWVVPADAPPGIVKYTVSATDSKGRTGEFKPFDVQTSQITIIE
jgi:hypothetical protein